MKRILYAAVVILISMMAVLAIVRVRFSSDVFELLPQNLPEARGLEQINRYFSRDAQLIITLKGQSARAVNEATASLANTLSQQNALIGDLFREVDIDRIVAEGGPLVAWAWFNGSPERLASLERRLASPRSSETLEESLEEINDAFDTESALLRSYDPLQLARFGFSSEGEGVSSLDPMRSPSGKFEIIYVEGSGVDFSDYRAVRDWLTKVRGLVEQWLKGWNGKGVKNMEVEIGYTGTPAFMSEVGAGMERDMTISVLLTLVLISALFFLVHRQVTPLIWLLAAMMGILAITLTIAELALGELSVISVGFAAILMGLSVDYAIVLYREALGNSGSPKTLRRAVGPGIAWAAVTTAAVFLSLNLSSLPGLAELGNLVALGILVGALVMLFGFAPVAVRFAGKRSPRSARNWVPSSMGRRVAGILAVLVPLAAIGSAFMLEKQVMEAEFHPFRMKESPALTTWDEMRAELHGESQTTPAVITAANFGELHTQLQAFQQRSSRAQEAGLIERVILPDSWVPHPEHQRRNAELLRALVREGPRLLSEIDGAGFTKEGMDLTREVMNSWTHYLDQYDGRNPVRPAGSLAKWTVDQIVTEREDIVAAVVALMPVNPRDREWVTAVCDDHSNIASLPSLGTALNERIAEDLWKIFVPMLVLLTAVLALVYRSWRELFLTLLALFFGGSVIVILTVWTPLSWNSFNVCGIPLLFGIGLDFSIHMLFALRRSGGDLEAVRNGMGKAVAFCGLSSAIGFGSLATASADGLSSLGVVCAIGILANTFVAVILLPAWYHLVHPVSNSAADSGDQVD